MKQTHYRFAVEIQAAPSLVWPVMAEVTRWPEWTPTILQVISLTDGSIRVGSRVRIHQPKLPPAIWQVTEWNPGQNFSWISTAPGVRVTARHIVESSGTGSRVILSLDYEGLLRELVAGLTHHFNVTYLEAEAKGLKAHCEAIAAGITPPKPVDLP